MANSRFRNAMTSRAGTVAGQLVQGRVLNVNLVNWTVDVVTQFDRKFYADVQVGASYLHYNSGEGIFVMPEVGAVIMIAIPSDSTAPYVQCFLAPMETANATGKFNDPDKSIVTTQQGTQQANTSNVDTSDAPDGTRSRGGKVPFPAVDARFDAGRPPAKPGDIFIRGRDGNYIVLHRGGVLEIGSTELAKRIYIPIGNKILDMSGQYEHNSTGGSVWWGLQEGPSIDNPQTQHMETFRLRANDQYADLRIAKGQIFKPVPEPAGSGGADAESNLNFDPITVYEIVLAQQAFKTVTGDPAKGGGVVRLKLYFTKSGDVFLRSEGSAYFAFKKKVTVSIGDALDVTCDTVSVVAKNGAVIDGGPSTEIKGDFVRLQGGTSPVSRVGDQIQGGVGSGPGPGGAVGVIQMAGAPVSAMNGVPIAITLYLPSGVIGSIISGNPNCTA